MPTPRRTAIYGMLDPRDYKIYYIGYTTLTLQQRLAWHIHDDRDTARCLWISGLLSLGLAPMMVELEIVRPAKNWPERERWWIQHGRTIGWPLTNVGDGGECPPRYSNNPAGRFSTRRANGKGKPK